MSDEAYKRIAEVTYRDLRNLQEFSLKMQGEYGKWLIASLLFLHGAAIGGLFFRATANSFTATGSLWWFVAGIILALGAGFSAFWNFFIAAQAYHEMADPRMLDDPSHWPKGGKAWPIYLTLWLAIVLGVLSALCLPMGAYFANSALSASKAHSQIQPATIAATNASAARPASCIVQRPGML